MEKTEKTERNNGNFNENGSRASNKPGEMLSIMMENYRKQLEAGFSLYSDYLGAFFDQSREMWSSSGQQAGAPSGEVSGKIAGMFAKSGDLLFRNLIDHNRNLVNSLSDQLERSSRNWNMSLERYQRNAEMNFETSRNMFELFHQTANRQAEVAMEAGKRLHENVEEHLKRKMKDNQEFWQAVAGTPGTENQDQKEQKEQRTKGASAEKDRYVDRKVPRKEEV